jgi:flavin reductase ActVB
VSRVRQLASAAPAPTGDWSAREFREAMAELVRNVYIVTARGRDRRPYGLVATSLCSYSCDPPSVLVCVGREGRARVAVASALEFGVHVLGGDQGHLARRFAAPGVDKFTTVDWAWDEGVPALAPGRVVVYLRCTRAAVMSHGDHIAVIGKVEHVETAPREPLVYRRRRVGWRLDHDSPP